jgi:hypothetical protein
MCVCVCVCVMSHPPCFCIAAMLYGHDSPLVSNSTSPHFELASEGLMFAQVGGGPSVLGVLCVK